ncbi:MAG: tetratricopeptide repeat protein [Gemmatimonadota bacterium]|nr:tetratricopeptide repeat protein [Gemmatimonadota bacterium]
MYTIARTIRRLSFTALFAAPFAVAACGGDTADARPVETVKTVKSPVPPPKVNTTPGSVDGRIVTTESPSPRPAVTGPVSYQDANDVFKAGHYPEAAEMFERYVAGKPDDAFGLYMLGLSSWKAGDFERAEQAFDKAIDIDPTFAKSYFNSARVLLDLKRAPEALERVEKGLAVDSTSADGWRLKARAQAATGDLDSAMATYRQLLVRNDQDLWGLNNLGVLMLDTGDYTGALGPLARVVQLRPTAPLFQNNYGMALERSGYPVAALHAYERAAKDDSTFTKAVKNAERMRGVVTDTTAREEVSLQDLAEQFRQKVKAWGDSTGR